MVPLSHLILRPPSRNAQPRGRISLRQVDSRRGGRRHRKIIKGRKRKRNPKYKHRSLAKKRIKCEYIPFECIHKCQFSTPRQISINVSKINFNYFLNSVNFITKIQKKLFLVDITMYRSIINYPQILLNQEITK